MKISNTSLDEFIEIYQKEFGKEISREDALEMATRLINLYLIIYRPLPGERRDGVTPPSGDHRDPDASVQVAE